MARRWVATIIQRGQELGVVRSDLAQTLLIDTTMGLLESLDRWVVTHWDELSEPEKLEMPQKHICLFCRLLSDESSLSTAVCNSAQSNSS